MDAAPTARTLPDLRLRLLKAAVVIPDLIISSLITFVPLAALPTDVAAGFIAGMLVASIIVGSVRAEGFAVRILHAARRPAPPEERQIAGPLRLVIAGSGQEDLRVLVGRGDKTVLAAGRRHVILHRGVVDAHRAGRITDAEVAALLAHGVGRLRCGQPRLDLLVALWTLPWDFLRSLARGIGRRLTWIPLVQFAWRTRFVVGTIAVAIETQEGRVMSAIIIATFILLTYVMPLAQRVWEIRLAEQTECVPAALGVSGGATRVTALFTSLRSCAGPDLRNATPVVTSWCRPLRRPGGSPNRWPSSSPSPRNAWRPLAA